VEINQIYVISPDILNPQHLFYCMLEKHVHAAFKEVIKKRKKRRLKRIVGAVIGGTLSLIAGAHWYFGCTAKDLEHEFTTYHSRIFEKETPVSLIDAQGKRHTISLIGDYPQGHDRLLKDLASTLPTNVIGNTYTIRFVDKNELRPGIGAHAHLLYNAGNLCIDKKSSVDTWVHELAHHGFFSTSVGDQIDFASINEGFYRSKLIPIRDYPDRWAQRNDLPAGETGPAFGFPSRYAAKHPYECASEMIEEIWRFTHPDLFNQDKRPSAYAIIFSDMDSHNIGDHKQRYEILASAGLLTDEMKSKMEAGFAGRIITPSTD